MSSDGVMGLFWCFHCYAVNDHSHGPCVVCGELVEPPTGLSWVDSLIWTLGHPDGDRAVLAARTLGRLKARQSVPALRAVVDAGADVYLRAEALRSLLVIAGPEPLGTWLEQLSREGPLAVRDIAREALHGMRRVT